MLKWGWLLACLAWCLLSKSCTTAKAKNKEPSVERKRAQQREIIESVEVDHAGESVTQKVKKGGSKKKVSKKTGSTKAKGNGEGSKPKKKLKSKTTLGSTSRILLASEEAELTPVLTDDPRTPAKTIKDGTGFAVTGRPVPVHRVPVAEMTRERLEYALHHGELLLIEGGAKAWPAMTKWNLPWFEKLFPNAAVEFRHAGSPAHNAQVGQITLKTYRKAAKKIGQPWYIGWGNQDEEASKRYFQPYMKTPAYFPASFESQGFRTEWMYFGSHLSGVGWHQDPQCHPKISIHMGGDKLWRLHAPWRHRNLGNTTATESIIWEMVIKEGDIFIFYPQYLHNTVVLGVNGSMAYTAYIETPRETPFIRELINAADNDPEFGKTYYKCYRPGEGLRSMTEMCFHCRTTTPGHALRPVMCDRDMGVNLCRDLAAGLIMEDELPWEIGGNGKPRKVVPGATRQRLTFSGSEQRQTTSA